MKSAYKNLPTSPPDHTAFAIGMVLLGISVVAVMDLITKSISDDMSLWQLLFMRSFLGLVILIPALVVFQQLPKVQVNNPQNLFIRSTIMVLSYITFFTSLAVLPIAVVAGSFFSSPLFVVLLSSFMLKEKPGVWRLSSVVLGFIGVLLILRPDSADFNGMFVLPVCAGFFYALTQVYTRKYCKHEEPLAISVWQTTLFMIIGLIGLIMLIILPASTAPGFLTYPLVMTGGLVTLILMGLAVGSLIMHFSLAAAYQNAPASLIAPLEYLYLPAAVIGGYVFFAEQPSLSALVGIAIIVTSGLIIGWRERVLRTL